MPRRRDRLTDLPDLPPGAATLPKEKNGGNRLGGLIEWLLPREQISFIQSPGRVSFTVWALLNQDILEETASPGSERQRHMARY